MGEGGLRSLVLLRMSSSRINVGVRPPDGEYAIHGTNEPSSIGRFAPYGCIRMFNEDMRDSITV